MARKGVINLTKFFSVGVLGFGGIVSVMLGDFTGNAWLLRGGIVATTLAIWITLWWK